jgi:hypothetical protein
LITSFNHIVTRMDAKLLEKRRRRLTAKTPLIGGWLRRRALSSLIRDGSTEATIALAEAARRGLDAEEWIDTGVAISQS